MPYSIEEHKHRFAAWAASRAASVNGCRFEVKKGKVILEKIGLNTLLATPDNLPLPEDIDIQHRQWRKNVIHEAGQLGLTFTHGVAAKLINVYLKSGFVCGGYQDHPRVKALHPPIDSLLLDGLAREIRDNNILAHQSAWKAGKAIRWSKFGSDDYERVIEAIGKSLDGRPLWEIEEYWPGAQ